MRWNRVGDRRVDMYECCYCDVLVMGREASPRGWRVGGEMEQLIDCGAN